MIYPIRFYGDPVLRKKSRAVTDPAAGFQVPGFDPVKLPELVENMFESMFEAGGVGLAAPQIGLPLRLFVVAEYTNEQVEEHIPLRAQVRRQVVALNPTLQVLDGTLTASHPDGCLSLPGIFSDGVKRPLKVRLTYTDLQGETQTEEAEGHWARVLQHEHDHLNGVLYFDHLGPDFLNRHRRELAGFQRKAREHLRHLQRQGWV